MFKKNTTKTTYKAIAYFGLRVIVTVECDTLKAVQSKVEEWLDEELVFDDYTIVTNTGRLIRGI